MPWQGTRDAYRIWLSEIMLQQTQVATVLPYYRRFVDEFPTVAALASSAQYWLGNAQYARRDYRGSIATQRQLLKDYPDSGKAPAFHCITIEFMAIERPR